MKKKIILAIVKWLIKYVPDHHVARNGGKKKVVVGKDGVVLGELISKEEIENNLTP